MIPKNSLVLYKNRPALVTQVGEKLMIEMEGGAERKVREKDVVLLHPGPLASLDDLKISQGEIATAWELLLEGGLLDLAGLAEFIYEEFTPASAWAAWELVVDGLYFEGAPDKLRARSPEEVAAEREAREAQAARSQAWGAFQGRIEGGSWLPEEDAGFLREIEDVAYGRRKDSRVLRELGKKERPETAHSLLLDLRYWDPTVNPYPVREGLPVNPPDLLLPPLPDETRLDLTHLRAYAIDDRDNQDPDDAISFFEGRIWVHVADAAALVPPDSPAEKEARARGATLYLPEGRVSMLPEGAIQRLGLGLQDVSPALSFGIQINREGEIDGVEIAPSWVRVERLAYADAEERLDEEPFRTLYHLSAVYQSRRAENGALFIDLPEIIMQVVHGQVQIRPVLPLRSRDLVREAMLMAGEAAAAYAMEHGLQFPYATQEPRVLEPPSTEIPPPEGGGENLAAFLALIRQQAPGEVRTQPGRHAGVGLSAYSRVTSPLRRYTDLVAHQQLRAFLSGQPGLDSAGLVERIGAADAVTRVVNRVERLSRQHWTLVYLLQNPAWSGDGVVVDQRGARSRLLIPDLAFETDLHLKGNPQMNQVYTLGVKGVNLPALEAYFKVLSD